MKDETVQLKSDFFFMNLFTWLYMYVTHFCLHRLWFIYRGSYMSGYLIWNLWNELCSFGILRAFGEQNTEISQKHWE